MIKIYELDGVLINSDNEENNTILENQGATEIDINLFKGQEKYLNYLFHGNTQKVGDIWVFTPDITEIEQTKKTEFYKLERMIALEIADDHKIGDGISDAQMDEVKIYLSAINPDTETRNVPVRPEIMSKYDVS